MAIAGFVSSLRQANGRRTVPHNRPVPFVPSAISWFRAFFEAPSTLYPVVMNASFGSRAQVRSWRTFISSFGIRQVPPHANWDYGGYSSADPGPGAGICTPVSCQNNLKEWGPVFKMYANESKAERYPSMQCGACANAAGDREVSLDVGPKVFCIYPECLTDLMIAFCSSDPNWVTPLTRVTSTRTGSWTGFMITTAQCLLAVSRWWLQAFTISAMRIPRATARYSS